MSGRSPGASRFRSFLACCENLPVLDCSVWKNWVSLFRAVLVWFPENPEYRNTRGLILARLGRNHEAVADLQLADAKLTNPKEMRLLLAKVYESLGNLKLAEQQRRLAGIAP